MKRRYLIIDWQGPHFHSEITKQDLARLKESEIDWIIDLFEEKYFDADANEWKDFITK